MPRAGSSHLWFSGEVALSRFQARVALRLIDRGPQANDFPSSEGGRNEFVKVDAGPPLPTSLKSPYWPRQRIRAVGRGFQSSYLCSPYTPPRRSHLSQNRN